MWKLGILKKKKNNRMNEWVKIFRLTIGPIQ